MQQQIASLSASMFTVDRVVVDVLIHRYQLSAVNYGSAPKLCISYKDVDMCTVYAEGPHA